jgi:hypothetical protein
MTTSSRPPFDPSLLSNEEKRDIQLLIEEFGAHVDLERINRAFMANEDSLTESDYRGLLTVNLFHLLGQARHSPDRISSQEKDWIFQTLGYLRLDPRNVLRDERLNFLRR